MLNRDKIFVLITSIILNACVNTSKDKQTTNYFTISKNIIGENTYHKILNQITDSIHFYTINKFNNYSAEYLYDYKVDSLLCFNNNGDRFIGCRHLYVNTPGAIADDLQYILGEKINNNWYIFKSASISVPRSMFEGHPENKPLSYSQLHHIALKEVYGGYLNAKNEINEDWFTSLFEGPGWGDFNDQSAFDWFLKGKRFKTKKEYYEFVRMEKVRNNWLQRDTTQPIIPLN